MSPHTSGGFMSLVVPRVVGRPFDRAVFLGEDFAEALQGRKADAAHRSALPSLALPRIDEACCDDD